MKYSVVVVDDHTLLSQAISNLVDSFHKFKTIYSCKNGQELINALDIKKPIPDIVLMDVNMPIMNGIETTKYLKQNFENIKVIALSIEENEDTILSMLRAGAKGYLMKDIEKNILEEALNEVILNGYYHTNTIAQILIGSLNKSQKVLLKDREIEFIKHACTEKTYKEIAKDMFVSAKTIEGYRDSVYEKLNLKNRIGLVLYAIRNNYFTP